MLTEKGYKGINYTLLEKLYPPIIKIIAPYNKNYNPLNIKEDSNKKDNNILPPASSKNGYITPSQFEEFWRLYPRKVDKGNALTRWESICHKPPKQRPTWKDIKRAILKQKNSDRWQDPKFIPYPTTWLNNNRWMDDPEEMKIHTSKNDTSGSGSRKFKKDSTQYVDHDSKL